MGCESTGSRCDLANISTWINSSDLEVEGWLQKRNNETKRITIQGQDPMGPNI